MKILVTAFDPFNNEEINPSLEVLKLLRNNIGDASIIKLEIPTVFYKSLDLIENAIIRENPDVILSLGQAGGRKDIGIERVGINIIDCTIADNDGNREIDKPIYEEAPNAYFATIPVKQIVTKINEGGIPASVSDSAGTFVCNHVLYGTAHLLANQCQGKCNGFIHIPYLPEQVIDKPQMPSMTLVDMVKGIELGIESIIENRN